MPGVGAGPVGRVGPGRFADVLGGPGLGELGGTAGRSLSRERISASVGRLPEAVGRGDFGLAGFVGFEGPGRNPDPPGTVGRGVEPGTVVRGCDSNRWRMSAMLGRLPEGVGRGDGGRVTVEPAAGPAGLGRTMGLPGAAGRAVGLGVVGRVVVGRGVVGLGDVGRDCDSNRWRISAMLGRLPVTVGRGNVEPAAGTAGLGRALGPTGTAGRAAGLGTVGRGTVGRGTVALGVVGRDCESSR